MKKIIFMGTPAFSATVLKGLIEANYHIIAAVTQPDRPVGRKKVLTAPPVKQLAMDYDIPVYQPEKLSGSIEMKELLSLEADLIVTAAYGQFVPTKLLKHPKYDSVNVHASLLPKYRGGAPIHYAIWNGDKETGVSIMFMEREMDAGDILSQATTPIGFEEDVADLFDRLAIIGRDLLLETLPKLFENQITPQVQNSNEVTYSPTISKEQEQINWHQSAEEIHNHVRAFRPFPSTYTLLNGQRIKLWQGQPISFSETTKYPSGTVVSLDEKRMVVACGEGYYAITELQPSGKKRMNMQTFINGIELKEWLNNQFQSKVD